MSLQFELFTLVLYITAINLHVKSRRKIRLSCYILVTYSGRRPSYIMLSSPYTCAQFRIVVVHFFVASKVARYNAFTIKDRFQSVNSLRKTGKRC